MPWFLRLKDILLRRPTAVGILTVEEMRASEQLIIRHVQEIPFSSELLSLAKREHVSRSSRLDF